MYANLGRRSQYRIAMLLIFPPRLTCAVGSCSQDSSESQNRTKTTQSETSKRDLHIWH